MPDSIKELIALNILDTINDIKIEDGYNYEYLAVRSRRNNFSDISPKDLTVIVKQADEEIEGEEIQSITMDQPFLLMAIVIDPDEETNSIESRRNKVEADIKKKILEDKNRGGFAIKTDMLPAREFDEGKGFQGISVNINVEYRTQYNDPNVKG